MHLGLCSYFLWVILPSLPQCLFPKRAMTLVDPKLMKKCADHAFDSSVGARANFQCCWLLALVELCWRYDINGHLGKFLSALRVQPSNQAGKLRLC